MNWFTAKSNKITEELRDTRTSCAEPWSSRPMFANDLRREWPANWRAQDYS